MYLGVAVHPYGYVVSEESDFKRLWGNYPRAGGTTGNSCYTLDLLNKNWTAGLLHDLPLVYTEINFSSRNTADCSDPKDPKRQNPKYPCVAQKEGAYLIDLMSYLNTHLPCPDTEHRCTSGVYPNLTPVRVMWYKGGDFVGDASHDPELLGLYRFNSKGKAVTAINCSSRSVKIQQSISGLGTDFYALRNAACVNFQPLKATAPGRAQIGTRIHVTGSGFVTNEPVTIKLTCATSRCKANPVVWHTVSDNDGFIGKMKQLSLMIPLHIATGAYSITAMGDMSDLRPPSARLMIGRPSTSHPQPTLKIVPVRGAPGTSVKIVGTGFPARAHVALRWFQCGKRPCRDKGVSLGSVITKKDGSFTQTIKVPATSRGGVHYVVAVVHGTTVVSRLAVDHAILAGSSGTKQAAVARFFVTIPIPLPKATPTRPVVATKTSTPTALPTSTSTASPTATPTSTSTASPTATPTSTATATPSATPTNTAAPTGTATSTPLSKVPVGARTGGAIWLTGHDADYHCSARARQCNYFKVAVSFVVNGSTLPVLALDHGTQVASAMTLAFGSAAPQVVTVDPRSPAFSALPLVGADGSRLYSAIVLASDTTCRGCDNNESGSTPDSDAVNARAPDIARFFQAGGGILALAGAENRDTYYHFLPVSALPTSVNPPFQLNSVGLALGLIEGNGNNSDDNCCETHNSFALPDSSSPFQVAETDSAGLAETLVVGASAVPVPTALPTNTPSPTATPTNTDTPSPTNTPAPTAAPTYTPQPTYTPRPTYTPQPTYTPRPTP